MSSTVIVGACRRHACRRPAGGEGLENTMKAIAVLPGKLGSIHLAELP
jgi:hypothetical protein